METDTRTCPDCAEEIKAQARVCRFCGYRFEDDAGALGRAEVPALEAEASLTAPVLGPTPVSSPKQRRWPRDLGYAGAVLLWILTAIPLSSQLIDPPRDGAEIAGGVTVAFVFPLGIAAAIRFVYAKLRKRRFASPWLFVVAALIAFASYVGQVNREQDRVNQEAVTRGVVQRAEDATPIDRCVARGLEALDALPADQRALIPGDGRGFFARVCAAADQEGNLTASGDIYATDEFRLAVCVEGMLAEFDRVPRAERAFTRTDFATFGHVYCGEALQRGIGANTPRSEIEALQDSVLTRLLESGEIRELP